MGKKNANKHFKREKPRATDSNSQEPTKAGNSKLSPQRRNELNQLVDKLLKVTSNVPEGNGPQKSWETHLEVDKLLNKIISLEIDITHSLPLRNEGSAKRLIEWMKENGSKIVGLDISPFEGVGFGLKASQDINENDMIVTVPQRLMLTSEGAKNSVLGNLANNDPMLQHMPNVLLSLYLLVERFSPESFWAPYIEMLPSDYTTVMYFTIDELKELKGSPTFEAALKQCKNIARQYTYFYNIFQRSSDPAAKVLKDVFTYEHYRWAASTVMTRQNQVPREAGGPMMTALIPFWDMANHDNAKMTTDYRVEEGETVCYACRDFAAGDQVVLCYGARSNADLLLHGGFAMRSNAADSVVLQLGVARADPLRDPRADLLRGLGVPPQGEFHLTRGSDPVDGRLLAFLRVFSMEKEHLDHWLSREHASDLVYPDCAIETAVENKMWSFLMARIKLLLAAYPTTLEEDENLLSDENELPVHKRLAVLQRLTEKEILYSSLEYVQAHIRS